MSMTGPLPPGRKPCRTLREQCLPQGSLSPAPPIPAGPASLLQVCARYGPALLSSGLSKMIVTFASQQAQHVTASTGGFCLVIAGIRNMRSFPCSHLAHVTLICLSDWALFPGAAPEAIRLAMPFVSGPCLAVQGFSSVPPTAGVVVPAHCS